MAKLILSSEGEVVDEFEIDKELIRIGRQEDNEITIDCLSVSNYHTQVMNIEDNFFVEDLGSTNGTYVNTEKVIRHCLDDGDILTLGSHNLKFEISSDSDQDAEEDNKLDTPHLLIKDGANDQITLNGGMTTLGKTGEHVAAITKRKDGYYCLHIDGGDKKSKTLVNGKAVASEGSQLKDHDIVKIAGVEVEFIS